MAAVVSVHELQTHLKRSAAELQLQKQFTSRSCCCQTKSVGGGALQTYRQ